MKDLTEDAAKSLQSSIILVNCVSLLKVGQEFNKEQDRTNYKYCGFLFQGHVFLRFNGNFRRPRIFIICADKEKEREEAAKGASEILFGILNQLKGSRTVAFLDDVMDKDLERLFSIARLACESDVTKSEAELKAVETHLNELIETKTGPFNKALQLFPTGQYLTKVVTDRALAFEQDKRCLETLQEVHVAASTLPTPKVEVTVPKIPVDAPPKFTLDNVLLWAGLRSKMATVEANASESFRNEHCIKMKECSDRISIGTTAVVDAIFERFGSVYAAEFSKFAAKGDCSYLFLNKHKKDINI